MATKIIRQQVSKETLEEFMNSSKNPFVSVINNDVYGRIMINLKGEFFVESRTSVWKYDTFEEAVTKFRELVPVWKHGVEFFCEE